MNRIDLNCDMGEGLQNDALLMPYLSSVNIACGYHAGDADTMKRTIALAVMHKVAIGAHPGFADKANFGRTELHLNSGQVFDLVTEQIYLLKKTAMEMGAPLVHVKPHGALYNMSAKDMLLASAIAKAVHSVDSGLVLFGLSGSFSITAARSIGLVTMSEVFADRTYQDDGSLTPRSQPGALIEDTSVSISQVLQMINTQTVTSVRGQQVAIVAETVCIHGDGAHAVDFAKNIYQTLQEQKIEVKSH